MRSLPLVFLLFSLYLVPFITCSSTQDAIAFTAGTSIDTREQMESYMNADIDADIDIDSESDEQQQQESEQDEGITLDHSIHTDTDQSIDAMLENANDALLEMNSRSETNVDAHLKLHDTMDIDADAEIDSEQEMDHVMDMDVAMDAETDAEMTMETDIEHEMEAFLNSETDSEATSDAELEVKIETGVDTDADVEYYNSTHRCNGRTHHIPALQWGRALFMNGRYVARLPGGVTPLWIPLRYDQSQHHQHHKRPKTMNLVLTTVPTRHTKKRYDFLKWVAASHRRHPFRTTIQILEFGLTPHTQNQLKLLTFHRTQLISVRWPGHRIQHNHVPKGFRHLKTFPQFKIKARRLEIEVSHQHQDHAGQQHVQRVLASRAAIWPRTQLSLIVRGHWESRAFPISLRRTPTSPTPRVTPLEYSFARYHRFQLWVARYEKHHGRLSRALYHRLQYKFQQSQYWLNHKSEPRGRVHSLQNITIIGTVATRLISTLGYKTLAYPGKLQDVVLQYTYYTPGSVISVQAQKLKLTSAVVAELSRGRTGINLTLGYKRARLRRSQTHHRKHEDHSMNGRLQSQHGKGRYHGGGTHHAGRHHGGRGYPY